jgi:hypothetical protein
MFDFVSDTTATRSDAIMRFMEFELFAEDMGEILSNNVITKLTQTIKTTKSAERDDQIEKSELAYMMHQMAFI